MIKMTSKLIAGMAVIAATFATSPSAANELDGTQLRTMIAGKRVFLATKWGIEFPLVYSASGQVTGDGSGIGLGQYFAPKETGEWWIAGNKMCQKFPTWYKGRTFCFSIETLGGNRFIWKRDDGASGKARLG